MINEKKLLEWMNEVENALIFGNDDDYEGFPNELGKEAVILPDKAEGDAPAPHSRAQTK